MTIDRNDLPNLDLEGLVDPGADRDTPISPGEILQEDFLKPLGLSATGLARALRVPANRITAVLKTQRGITADTAMRLARYFGTTPEFWMHLQSDYELRLARRDLAEVIAREVTPRAA